MSTAFFVLSSIASFSSLKAISFFITSISAWYIHFLLLNDLILRILFLQNFLGLLSSILFISIFFDLLSFFLLIKHYIHKSYICELNDITYLHEYLLRWQPLDSPFLQVLEKRIGIFFLASNSCWNSCVLKHPDCSSLPCETIFLPYTWNYVSGVSGHFSCRYN